VPIGDRLGPVKIGAYSTVLEGLSEERNASICRTSSLSEDFVAQLRPEGASKQVRQSFSVRFAPLCKNGDGFLRLVRMH
jgi:hypothetical protein